MIIYVRAASIGVTTYSETDCSDYMKRRILILYTGNSRYSQMAEAISAAHRGSAWEVVSVRAQPTDQVHPQVPPALRETGIVTGDRIQDTSTNFPVGVGTL